MEYIYPLLAIWLIGVPLHFVYDWTGQNPFIGLFAPVSESVWEHYKLVFYPLLIVGLYLGKQNGILNMGMPLALALLHSAFMMFGIFYFYTTAFGTKTILLVDIASFFVTSSVGYFILQKYGARLYGNTAQIIGWAEILVITIAVWYFTYKPLNVPLFIDFSKKRK